MSPLQVVVIFVIISSFAGSEGHDVDIDYIRRSSKPSLTTVVTNDLIGTAKRSLKRNGTVWKTPADRSTYVVSGIATKHLFINWTTSYRYGRLAVERVDVANHVSSYSIHNLNTTKKHTGEYVCHGHGRILSGKLKLEVKPSNFTRVPLPTNSAHNHSPGSSRNASISFFSVQQFNPTDTPAFSKSPVTSNVTSVNSHGISSLANTHISTSSSLSAHTTLQPSSGTHKSWTPGDNDIHRSVVASSVVLMTLIAVVGVTFVAVTFLNQSCIDLCRITAPKLRSIEPTQKPLSLFSSSSCNYDRRSCFKVEDVVWTFSSSSLSKEVDEQGGDYRSGNLCISVPPGAVRSKVQIRAEFLLNVDLAPHTGSSPKRFIFSPILALQPHGWHFEKPVSILFPFTATSQGWILELMRQDSEESWRKVLAIDLDNRLLIYKDEHCNYNLDTRSLELNHFCKYVWCGYRKENVSQSEKMLFCMLFARMNSSGNSCSFKLYLIDHCDDVVKNVKELETNRVRPSFDLKDLERIRIGLQGCLTVECKSDDFELEGEPEISIPLEKLWLDKSGHIKQVQFSATLATSGEKDAKLCIWLTTSGHTTVLKAIFVLPGKQSSASLSLSRLPGRIYTGSEQTESDSSGRGSLAVMSDDADDILAQTVAQFSDKERESFFNALKAGRVRVRRAHINVVGKDRSGKTCFVRAMLGKLFEDQASTKGITIKVITKYAEDWIEILDDKDKFYLDKAIAQGWRHAEETNESIDKAAHGQPTPKKLKLDPKRLRGVFTPRKKSTKKSTKHRRSSAPQMRAGPSEQKVSDIQEKLKEIQLTDQQMGELLKLKQQTEEQAEQQDIFLAIIWDHAGQELCLPAHTALMGDHSEFTSGIYIGVFDQSKLLNEEATSEFQPSARGQAIPQKLCWIKLNKDNLCYWLTQLQCAHAEQPKRRYMGRKARVLYPPMILVGTHDDDPKAEKNREEQNKILEEMFRDKKYVGHLVKPDNGSGDLFFRVDNTKSGHESEDPAREVKAAIDEMTEDCWSEHIQPISYLVLEKILRRLEEITGWHIVDLPFFSQLAEEVCRIANTEISTVLKYFSSLGVVLHYPELDGARKGVREGLKEKVFIDPEWLVGIMSAFINGQMKEPPAMFLFDWNRVKKDGIITWPLVIHFLDEAQVLPQDRIAVLGILCLFDLICPVDKEAELKEGMRFYAPGLIHDLYHDTTTEPFVWQQWRSDSSLPPPLILTPSFLDTFPEPLYQRLVVRTVEKHPSPPKLHRNRCLVAITDELDLELAYQDRRYVVASINGPQERRLPVCNEKLSELRQFLCDEVEDAKQRGMRGFEFEPCVIAKTERLTEADVQESNLVSLANFSSSQPLRTKKLETIGLEFRDIFGCWFYSAASAKTVASMTAYDADKVLRAVQTHGCNQWYSIACKMGFTSAQAKSITATIHDDAGKLQAVFADKVRAVGPAKATAVLLEACKRISSPIIGDVMNEITK